MAGDISIQKTRRGRKKTAREREIEISKESLKGEKKKKTASNFVCRSESAIHEKKNRCVRKKSSFM